MKKNFSEGKWSVEEDTFYNGIHFIWCESELSHIPKLVARTCFAPDSIANAKLIAAAPALFEALNDLIIANELSSVKPAICCWDDLINKAKETIKKATE